MKSHIEKLAESICKAETPESEILPTPIIVKRCFEGMVDNNPDPETLIEEYLYKGEHRLILADAIHNLFGYDAIKIVLEDYINKQEVVGERISREDFYKSDYAREWATQIYGSATNEDLQKLYHAKLKDVVPEDTAIILPDGTVSTFGEGVKRFGKGESTVADAFTHVQTILKQMGLGDEISSESLGTLFSTVLDEKKEPEMKDGRVVRLKVDRDALPPEVKLVYNELEHKVSMLPEFVQKQAAYDVEADYKITMNGQTHNFKVKFSAPLLFPDEIAVETDCTEHMVRNMYFPAIYSMGCEEIDKHFLKLKK